MKTSPSFRNMAIAVFAILFMTLAASAFNVNDYLASTESPASITQTTASVGGVSYTIYAFAGKDTLVVKNGAIVKDKNEMSSVLKARCFDTSYPSAAELNEINTLVLSFNESRQQPTSFGGLESFCDSIVGQSQGDQGGCLDLTSCQIACNQASYSCMQYAQGSAIFLPELLSYATIKRNINNAVDDVISTTATLKGATSASQLSFSIADKINAISKDISAMQNESTNYAANKLFTVPIFQFCIPVGVTFSLNTSALTTASTKASALAVKSSCFNDVSAKTDQLFNETFTRIELYTSTTAKTNLQQQFNSLTARYNNLTDRANSALAISNDQQIPQFVTDVEALNAQYYNYSHNNDVDQAGLILSQIDSKLNDFGAYLNETYDAFGALIGNKSAASEELAKAGVAIESNDASLSADLSRLQDQYIALSLKLSAKISRDEAPTYAAQFEGIANQTAALIDKKRQLEGEQVPQLVSGAMRSISMMVLDSAAGSLGIKETDKRAWTANIPLIVIAFVDIVILAVFSIAFFFLVVRKTSTFARPKVMRSWGIILVAVLLLVIGLSVALNAALTKETGPVSVFSFITGIKSQQSATVFMERLSADDASAIGNCSDAVVSKLTALGLTVTKVDVIDGICNDKPLSDCLSDIGQTPSIRLQFSNKNSTQFFTFYRPEAVVTGDAKYFADCVFGQFIE